MGLRMKMSVFTFESSKAYVSFSNITIWFIGIRLFSLKSYEKFRSSKRF